METEVLCKEPATHLSFSSTYAFSYLYQEDNGCLFYILDDPRKQFFIMTPNCSSSGTENSQVAFCAVPAALTLLSAILKEQTDKQKEKNTKNKPTPFLLLKSGLKTEIWPLDIDSKEKFAYFEFCVYLYKCLYINIYFPLQTLIILKLTLRV